MGQHLTQNANDKQEVTPALKEIKETTDELPDIMSLDNGYMSGNNQRWPVTETPRPVHVLAGRSPG